MALGGVPTGVPIPPMLAATGIASAMPTRNRSVRSRVASTGSTTAMSVAVVAVFDMNIDSPAVMTIRPSMIAFQDVPNGRSMTRAMLRSRWNFAEPSARKKPPRNSMITGWARAPKKTVNGGASAPLGTSKA